MEIVTNVTIFINRYRLLLFYSDKQKGVSMKASIATNLVWNGDADYKFQEIDEPAIYASMSEDDQRWWTIGRMVYERAVNDYYNNQPDIVIRDGMDLLREAEEG